MLKFVQAPLENDTTYSDSTRRDLACDGAARAGGLAGTGFIFAAGSVLGITATGGLLFYADIEVATTFGAILTGDIAANTTCK